MERLRTALLDHLDHEERELEPFYLEHHDHPGVMAMARDFRQRNVSKEAQSLMWVTDGATPDERSSIAVPAGLRGDDRPFARRYRKEIAPVCSETDQLSPARPAAAALVSRPAPHTSHVTQALT